MKILIKMRKMKNRIRLMIAICMIGLPFSLVASPAKKAVTLKIHTAEEAGIQFFKGTWQEALNLSKSENKLIFLDAYASWCGPCKIMARTTFMDENVAAFFNKHFINVKMDMEKDLEGPRLSGKYKLIAYPTLYFIDSTENVVQSTMGYYKPKPFIKYGQMVVNSTKEK